MGLVPGHPEGLGLVLGRVSLEQHSNLQTVGSLDGGTVGRLRVKKGNNRALSPTGWHYQSYVVAFLNSYIFLQREEDTSF